MNLLKLWTGLALVALVCLPLSAAEAKDPGSVAPEGADCSLLDDAKARGKMDGLLRWLLIECDREEELGQVRQDVALEPVAGEGSGILDVQVNDSSGDSGSSTTQSETSIVVSETTGTYCSGYNDSFSGIGASSFAGFSRSTDDGASWDDRGALPAPSSGDPSVVWSRRDDKFYFAALRSGGLGIWRSDDDCQTFLFVSSIASGNDDKELMAVDNNPGSPFYGRLYVAWTDFGSGSRIYSTFSDDGGASWSTQLALSAATVDVQGAWPTVAPNGDVFVGWLRWNPFPSGPVDIEIARSTDGGVSFSLVTNPMTGQVNPRDSGATASCGRPALNENIRYLPSPQLAVGEGGVIHVVYSYDPDGFDTGDVVDVFYRRSDDNGATWETEVLINDDGGLNDQYFPTLSLSPEGIVVVTFYDRRLDAANQLQDTFKAVSADGGVNWLPNERVSDVSTPIYLDPNLATCYHGDYDQNTQEPGFALLQWSDDRLMFNGHNDPDVWFELEPVSDDYLLVADPGQRSICVPDDAIYDIDVLSFQGFAEPVTLSTMGEPGGTSVGFSQNPVTPPGSTVMTISDTGAAMAGPYDIVVSGLSSPSGIVRETSVGLMVFDDTPEAPTLTAPANGATDVALTPTFEWTAGVQSQEYTLEVDDDPGFGSLDYSVTVTETSHLATSALAQDTLYFWRVRPANLCGEGATSAVFSFTTLTLPPVLLVDDDDNAPDVRPYYTDALTALGVDYDLWDTVNSDDEPGFGELAGYRHVVWFTGDEFGGVAGPGGAGETALAGYLDAGGCLFLSSQDYHYDRGLTTFMEDYLGVGTIDDDTGDYASVSGEPGSIFAGMGPYPLDYTIPGLSDFSDPVEPDATALLALRGDNSNGAGLQKLFEPLAEGGTVPYGTVFFAFPWEALSTAGAREAVLQAILDFCPGGPLPAEIFADDFESGDTSAWSSTMP